MQKIFTHAPLSPRHKNSLVRASNNNRSHDGIRIHNPFHRVPPLHHYGILRKPYPISSLSLCTCSLEKMLIEEDILSCLTKNTY